MDNQVFRLGTAVLITSVLSEAPDSVNLTIRNPSGIKVVDNQAMTKETDEVYSYVYQSSDVGTEGDYTIIFSAVLNGYTSIVEDTFSMIRQTWVNA